VVESGFPELEGAEDEKAKYAEENSHSWDFELGEQREYVSRQIRESARQSARPSTKAVSFRL
jgi:hypothetical protein